MRWERKPTTSAAASAGSGSARDTATAATEDGGTAVNATAGTNKVENDGDGGQKDQFDMERCGNHGAPIQVEWDGKTHGLVDGFGMCSPTRWPPKSRGHKRPQVMQNLATRTFQCLEAAVKTTILDVRREAFKLVTGKIVSSPFSEEVLGKVRQQIAYLLRDPSDALVRDGGQPFFLRLLAQWLEVFEDPDVDCLVNAEESFASGVNVGVEAPLPRSPQGFPLSEARGKDGPFIPCYASLPLEVSKGWG